MTRTHEEATALLERKLAVVFGEKPRDAVQHALREFARRDLQHARLIPSGRLTPTDVRFSRLLTGHPWFSVDRRDYVLHIGSRGLALIHRPGESSCAWYEIRPEEPGNLYFRSVGRVPMGLVSQLSKRAEWLEDTWRRYWA